MTATAAATAAFREAYLHADTLDPDGDFSALEARRLRYQVMWAYFQNDAYRLVNKWASKMKADYGLYKHTRNIYSPAYRLASFWQTHLWGGLLGVDADGRATATGALPILTSNEALRRAIGRLWRDSNWQINKDILTLWGATLGDAVLRVVDDPEHQRVYLQRIHPGTLTNVVVDAFGNVKAYEIQEERVAPTGGDTEVTYRETAVRDGENVVYATYLNNAPYAWNGVAAEWAEPYGFIPLVLAQHNNVGLPWGWSEFHPVLSKVREADDLASKLSDQIRKQVDPLWLFAGVKQPASSPTTPAASATSNKPEPGREETSALYSTDANAKAQPLVANVDVTGTLKHIENVLADIERDYPELKFQVMRMGGNISAEALRTAQEPVEDKVNQRRPNYDDALRRAQQMAVAIGGLRGYAGYEGFGLDSYKSGALDHQIGPRPVFGVTTDEQLKRAEAKRKLLVPAPTLWSELGYNAQQVDEMAAGAEYRAYLQSLGLDLTANG